MTIPITETMRRRMKSTLHTRQADEELGSDFRPSGEVYMARGAMRRHHHPPYPRDLIPEQRRNAESRWRGDWDEKYAFLGQHGQEGEFHIIPDTHPPQRVEGGGGNEMHESLQGPIRLPYLKSITVRNSLDQNGVGQATVVLQNAEWKEMTTSEMTYHLLREGFFSPFYGGEDLGMSDQEKDRMGGLRPGESYAGGLLYDENGKRISGLIVPNRHIDIYQGYGDELQRTFTGLVDSVEVSSNPRQITINCSDFGRVLADTPFIKQTTPPGNWPVAFGDRRHWLAQGDRKEWPDKGAPRNMITVSDITSIVGHILGWAGFQYFKSPRVGRIGGAAVDAENNEVPSHNAVFEGEAFGMGSHFIDGINRIKEILGFHFYVTPEFAPSRPLADRFRDPTEYDAEYSRYSIGLPYFVPPNIWTKEPVVEQYLDDDALINANLTYDIEPIRNSIYVFNTGLKMKRPGGGTTQTIGMHSRHGLAAGLPRVIFYNLKEAMGNVTLSAREVEILILMTFIQTLMYYVKGTITVPGHPGAKVNDQCDILERTSGTWRRFFIWGFDSQMTFGQNATYRTTFQVSNMDNVMIHRLKAAIRLRQRGFPLAVTYQGSIRETSPVR